jgi:hypothetical protein
MPFLVIFALTLSIAAGAFAQTPAPESQPAATPGGAAKATRTGKERLGNKWADEQRIDNCNVPLDKRGEKPRPDCPEPAR